MDRNRDGIFTGKMHFQANISLLDAIDFPYNDPNYVFHCLELMGAARDYLRIVEQGRKGLNSFADRNFRYLQSLVNELGISFGELKFATPNFYAFIEALSKSPELQLETQPPLDLDQWSKQTAKSIENDSRVQLNTYQLIPLLIAARLVSSTDKERKSESYYLIQPTYEELLQRTGIADPHFTSWEKFVVNQIRPLHEGTTRVMKK